MIYWEMNRRVLEWFDQFKGPLFGKFEFFFKSVRKFQISGSPNLSNFSRSQIETNLLRPVVEKKERVDCSRNERDIALERPQLDKGKLKMNDCTKRCKCHEKCTIGGNESEKKRKREEGRNQNENDRDLDGRINYLIEGEFEGQ